MSIQIITGFSLNGSEPIDTRIVASGSSERDAITYKYQGLRVFDLSDNKPYVYIGATWSEEGNANQVLGLSGSVARFTSNNSVGSSNIYQLGSNVGINSTNPLASVQFGPTTSSSLPFVIHKGGGLAGTIYVDSTVLAHNWYYTGAESYFNSLVGSSKLIFGSFGDIHFQNKAGGPGGFAQSIYISPSGRVGIGSGFGIGSQPGSALVVNGTITAAFSGSGAGLTNISPSGISNTSQLSVGTASSSLNSNITRVPTGSGTHYLTFIGAGAWSTGSGIGAGVGNEVIRANNTDLTYVPDTKTLTVGTVSSTRLVTNLGSITTPSLSFTGDSNTGIYSPSSDNLAFVTNGVERFRVKTGAASDFQFKSLTGTKTVGLSVYDSGYTTLTLSPSTATSFDIGGFTSGLYVNGPFSASGAKSFKITHPHPSKSDNYNLVHASVESSRIENLYRGKVELSNGLATINLDSHSNMTDGTFVLFNRDPFVMTTSEDSFIRVRGSVSGNILTIESETSSNDSVNWLVICERCDGDIMSGFNTDEDGKLITEIPKPQNN